MISQKVWSYIGSEHNILDLYPLASTVSLAKVWAGTPLHDAVYPYPPALAYYFTAIGWMHKLMLPATGNLVVDSGSLEFIIKFANTLFGLADSVLIYLIVRGLGLSRRSSFFSGGLFLFNPGVWSSMTIWGQTEVVVLFPLLLSVLLANRNKPFGAWLALGVLAITRLQMAIPVVILALVYSKRFTLRENIPAISWSIIIIFILLSPFSLRYGPSSALESLWRPMVSQRFGGAIEQGQLTVSRGAYSIWPLITGYLERESGRERSLVLDGEELVGGWSYRQVSNYLVAGLLLAVAVAIVLKRRANMTGNYYLPLLALAMLGWALLTTGMSARDLIYPLCLLILARPALSGGGFLAGVAMISTTIAITVLGTFAFHISGVPELVPALHADNNAGARLFMFLYSDDRVITLGSFGNMVVLVWLAAAVFRLPLLPWGRGNKEVAADSEE